MKLFTKYNRINLVATIVIFLLGCAAFSVLLRYVIINQIDEDLLIEKNEVLTYINKFGRLPSIVEVRDQYTTYTKIGITDNKEYKITSRNYYNAFEEESELRRIIAFNVEVNNDYYKVEVSKSLEGADDLIQTIIAITVILILLILSASFIVNRIVLKKLWQPFYNTINKLLFFKLNDKDQIEFENTKIEEFNYLNETLLETLGKAQHDYQILKEFTENASHELQTPLAIIRSKLDVLIQNEDLTQQHSEAIKGAYDAVQNLSRMNQSLLLLAKIENRQFADIVKINLRELLEQKIDQFDEIWKEAKIKIAINLEDSFLVGNVYLVNILLNNLFSNSTKHNKENGFINIELKKGSLTIINSGINNTLIKEQLFNRFSRQINSETHHGIGLSINKQICDALGYNLEYNFQKPDHHVFTIKW